jgi:O-antigen ligase
LKIQNTIQNAFFNYGWLLPLLLPTVQVMGRGVTNTLWAAYLAWALVAMVGAQTRIPRSALAIYFALPIAFLCGVLAAEDIGAALHAWVKFTLHSLVFLFTLVALASRPRAAQRMLRCAGYAGLLLVTVLLVALCWQVTQPDFVPVLILQEDNLPFLTPFILALLWNTTDSRTRLALMVITTLIISGYVLYSDGRAALLGLTVALFLSMLFILRIKPTRALLIMVLFLGSAIALSSTTFFRDDRAVSVVQDQRSELLQTIDRFTSYRAAVWRQAIEHPPRHCAIGVGMSNVRLSQQVVTIKLPNAQSLRIAHLHNFILDAWYETGFIGLFALLAFLFYPIWQALQRLRSGGETTAPIGLVLASVAALLVSGLLSFSYTSRQFAFYLPMLLAALWHLSAHVPKADRQADKHGPRTGQESVIGAT